MKTPPANGTRSNLDGVPRIFYDGYWIRYYAPPDDTLGNRKQLIDHLTRRTFHHTEAGINTPGRRLEEARLSYQNATDSRCKRVNAAMLAGALFNRATDLFTTIVDLGERGVVISRSNELMQECSRCFREALDLGKQVKHHSGEEGIDELWGEPFKAFTQPPATFYESRYIKIAQSMRDLDSIKETMQSTFANSSAFAGIDKKIGAFATAAKRECETMKADPCIFKIWPSFVAAAEQLESFEPCIPTEANDLARCHCRDGVSVLCKGKRLLCHIASARVPMPNSTHDYLQLCKSYYPPF